jgi:hypothetical protein
VNSSSLALFKFEFCVGALQSGAIYRFMAKKGRALGTMRGLLDFLFADSRLFAI